MQTVCNTYWDAGKGNLTAQNTRKPFGGMGSAPDPAGGAYSASANPLAGGEGLAALPKNPIPRCRAFGPRLSYPHSKISSDAVARKSRSVRTCATRTASSSRRRPQKATARANKQSALRRELAAPMLWCYYYLRQGGYVFIGICSFVRLFVC